MLATTPQTRCTAMNTLPPSLLPRRPFGACSSKQEIALELSCRSTSAAVSARRCRLLRLAAAGAGTSLPPLPVQPGQPVVKVCGVTNAEDAEAAAAAGVGQSWRDGALKPLLWGLQRPTAWPSCHVAFPRAFVTPSLHFCRGAPDWHDLVAPCKALCRRHRGNRHCSSSAAARGRAGGRVCG